MPHLLLHAKHTYYQNGGVEPGEGRPWVIFIHGAGMDHSVWQQQSRALAHHGYDVAAVDLPSHGESEAVPGIGSVADYGKWVQDFMDAMGIGQTALMPGEANTPWSRRRSGAQYNAEEQARRVQPEDVAAAMKFLALLPRRATVPELPLNPTNKDIKAHHQFLS